MIKFPWILLASLVFCSCKSQQKKSINEENKLSVLIFHDSVIVYNGKLDKNTPYKKYLPSEMEELNEVIANNRKKFGDDLEILLKVADSGTGGISDNLLFMTRLVKQNGGPGFKRADADEADQTLFKVIPFPWSYYDSLAPRSQNLLMPKDGYDSVNSSYPSGPPPPVEITTPESVSVQLLPQENAFLIDIRKDESVWYQIISTTGKMGPQKINPPVTKNLKSIIADYENSSPDIKRTYLIKGDRDASYSSIKQVIDALKENNIYKYNLVTAEN